ncbi:hypothetical protein STVIR_2549 [Streptomyces viridochromogenes Tue57]|uniref:Secreted protein n=1 Tax=Streptomyces viridochromogenes Tue57 TaxID=1160705 RepID=L8PFW6_STRVR|nr:hypothetical protein STVIR_2549 [Streptomyces viridochromogenes Tue57]
MLLAALVICLGVVGHGQSTPAADSTTTVSTTGVLTGTPSEDHTTTAAHPTDCQPGDACCRASADGVRAVLAAPTQPLPAILPRTPEIPRQPDIARLAAEPTPVCLAPDLHLLQVQRT